MGFLARRQRGRKRPPATAQQLAAAAQLFGPRNPMPQRAAVADPEPKPPEAMPVRKAVEGAGSSSETKSRPSAAGGSGGQTSATGVAAGETAPPCPAAAVIWPKSQPGGCHPDDDDLGVDPWVDIDALDDPESYS